MPNKKYTLEVYRPRLERVTVTVTAASEYEATNKAFEKADTLAPEKWDMLPTTTDFYCGHTGWDGEMFIPEEGSLIPGSDKPGYVPEWEREDAGD